MSALAEPQHAVADTATVRLRITDLAAHDRPRERLLAEGAPALGDAELLAIVLRTGAPGANAVELARRLLRDAGAGRWTVDHAEVARLRQLAAVVPRRHRTGAATKRGAGTRSGRRLRHQEDDAVADA